MQTFNLKSPRALLILSLFIIFLLIPESSFAYYSGRHHGSYGHRSYGHHGYSRRHYGYRRYGGHSRRYGYRRYGGHSRRYGYRRYGSRRYYPYKYYRGKHYGYSSSSRYRYYPRSYSFSVPANTKVYSAGNVNQQSNVKYSGINSSAWQTLGQGQYSTALNSFAIEAQSHPKSSVPKAGYALASASNGNLEKGVWAMRRAFRIDPDSLHYLQLDEKNQILIDNLIDQYTAQKNDAGVDQAFMVSALYYLKHDYTAAKKSMTTAQQNGDTSSSSTNLNRLIDQQVAGEEN